MFALLLIATPAAFAACPESMSRDPTFVLLAVDEKALRPNGAEDFNFIDDSTTLDQVSAKVGSPDAAKGQNTFVWCLANGTIVTISSRDGSDIRYVRVGSKTIYKRK
jgi:hypothetical protein